MNWYSNRRKEWKEAIEQTAQETGRLETYIEKDSIQSMFLERLSKSSLPFVFKGGTCLSKGYRLIDRFSEDIDLSFYRPATVSERKKSKSEILSIAESIGLVLANPDSVMSGHSFNRYLFSYDSLFEEGVGELLVETNYYQPADPVATKNIHSLVGDVAERFGTDLRMPFPKNGFEMKVLTLERTFVDKVFAVCDYRIANMKDRDSRHIYDIFKILPKIRVDGNLRSLIDRVRKERMSSKNNPSAQPECDIPSMLREIIDSRFYESDYEKVTSLLLYEDVGYETAVGGGIAKVAETDLFEYRG